MTVCLGDEAVVRHGSAGLVLRGQGVGFDPGKGGTMQHPAEACMSAGHTPGVLADS